MTKVAAMDETTSRILDTLWKQTGRPISIRELTFEIRESYGTAHYANIYRKILALAKERIINLTKAGRSSLANLNFAEYLLIDILTELELKRKHDLLTRSHELQILLKDIEERYEDIRSIESISAINAERNLKLNRAELLILMHRSKGDDLPRKIINIHEIARELQAMHNIKLDPLILTTDEFLDFLTSDDTNPLREMLSSKLAFHSPQEFWREIATASAKGKRISLLERETNPAKISEKDLIFNLARFGYKEIGLEITEGERICIEYITTSIMMRENARRIDAIPIILAKSGANYNLLIFLSQKYGLSARFFGLLKALDIMRPTKETANAIEILKVLKTKEIRADEKAIAQRMRLYNAIR